MSGHWINSCENQSLVVAPADAEIRCHFARPAGGDGAAAAEDPPQFWYRDVFRYLMVEPACTGQWLLSTEDVVNRRRFLILGWEFWKVLAGEAKKKYTISRYFMSPGSSIILSTPDADAETHVPSLLYICIRTQRQSQAGGSRYARSVSGDWR